MGRVIIEAAISDLPMLGEIRRLAIMAQPETFWKAEEKELAADAWATMDVQKNFAQYRIYIFDEVGFVGWKADYLGYIFLLPEHQSNGLGGEMLQLAETEIRKAHNQIWLWAHPYSEKFYQKHDFVKLNETEIPFGNKPLHKFSKKLN